MPVVDSNVAAWLKAEALYSSGSNVAAPANLLVGATESEIISGLATLADADAETTRQLGFLNYPQAIDVHSVPGQRKDLLGKVVSLTANYLGYDTARTVFVIGVQEKDNNTTTLYVVRRLT